MASTRVNPPSANVTNQLAHDIRHTVFRAHVVDGDDVGMIQGSYCARLEFEPLTSGRVRGGRQRKNLHGYLAFQPLVARTIHLAHATGSDNREDLIRPQTSS